KVSTSAQDARSLGLLRPQDEISMNPERLIADAKALALSLVPNYAHGLPRTDVRVCGEAEFALLKTGIYLAHEGGYISDYEAQISENLAYMSTGVRIAGKQTVSAQDLLDLEREAYVRLCGQPK